MKSFLALRSYLPADHPDKALEIGSEATPGEFLDVMLDVVEGCARVLAPHGSLVFELGDTYSGSTADGDDWTNVERGRPDKYVRGIKPTETGKRKGVGWPLDKSKVLVPQLFAIALAYGFNPLTGRTTEPWRVRNTVAWCRPNPPVGRDGDKFRPATSFLTVACKARDRYWDGDAVRTAGSDNTHTRTARGVESRPSTGKTANDEARGGNFSTLDTLHATAGAPLLDWWEIPTAPYKGAHYATFSPKLVEPVILSMAPAFVCTACGTALGLWRDAPRTDLSGVRGPDHEQVADEQHALLLESVRQSAHCAEPQDHQGLDYRFEGLHPGPGPGAPNGEPRRLRHGTPVGHGAEAESAAVSERSGASHQRGEGRQPPRESDGDGQGAARRSSQIVAPDNVPTLWRARSSSEPCPACGGTLRVGRVLDPFAGSGTTLAVATGHGLDAIGIDLDARNAELAYERIGMFLTVEPA